MSIYDYLKENGYEDLTNEALDLVKLYEDILAGVNSLENVKKLLSSENTFFIEDLLKYDVLAIYNLDLDTIELLSDFIKENFLFDFDDVFTEYINTTISQITWDGVTDKNIDEALKFFEIGLMFNASVDDLAWSLAYYYEFDNFDLTMKYFDYAYQNSCNYFVLEYYGAKCIRFASKYWQRNEHKICIDILENALDCVCKAELDSDFYQEYLEILVHLIGLYKEDGLLSDEELLKKINSGIAVGLEGVEKLRVSRGDSYYGVSDSDTERALLSLYLYKLDYLLEYKKYEEFMSTYNFGMEEIALSSSTRYYAPFHAKFDKMIEQISNEKTEFAFVKDLTSDVKVYFKDEIHNAKEVQNLTNEFALIRKDNNSSLNFNVNEVVVDGEDVYLVANPNYPLLGEGKKIVFMVFFKEETYLTVIDWSEYNMRTAHLYFKNVITI